MNRRAFLFTPAFLPAILGAQSEEGFAPLFDGQTLNGWTIRDGPESAFYARDGEIAASPSSIHPCWLRSGRQYENFDFRCEFFVKGWIDGGVYLHAPEHGRNTFCGMQVKIFHQLDKTPMSNSMGAIFPLIAPSKVNVRSDGQWNTLRMLMDWPQLSVWVNGEQVQDLNVEQTPELRHRLRRGYLGLSGLGYPIRFRNLRIKELPDKEQWQYLFEADADLEKNWFVSESAERAPAKFEAMNGVLRGDGAGHLATREKYRDFVLQLYVRGPRHHNGGILIRSLGRGLSDPRHYEIQIHNVEEAHYSTGSLYHHKRSIYPRIEDDQWFLMQVVAQGRKCLVRVNGEDVMEYDQLENLEEGHIELQAHQPGVWLEYKHIRVRRL
ncbi:MAG TPA: DUF1080 domain-containing protein [Bryobacteraceae bacterium]|nr:DUF1080 domain-containing protein [Bryobacteraceae bacterium]